MLVKRVVARLQEKEYTNLFAGDLTKQYPFVANELHKRGYFVQLIAFLGN